MSDSQDSLVDEQLDARVDALIQEIDTVSTNIARAIGDDSVDPELEDILSEPDDSEPDDASEPESGPADVDPQDEADDDPADARVDEDDSDASAEAAAALGDADNVAVEDVDQDLENALPAETPLDVGDADAEGDALDEAGETRGMDDDAAPAIDDQISAMLGTAAEEISPSEEPADAGIEPLVGDEAEAILRESVAAAGADDDAAGAEPASDTEAHVRDEPRSEPETETESETEIPTETEAEAEAEAEEPVYATSVEDLDAELAGLADELLEGDFDDVDDVLEAGNPDDAAEISEPLKAAAESNADEEGGAVGNADALSDDSVVSVAGSGTPDAEEARRAETASAAVQAEPGRSAEPGVEQRPSDEDSADTVRSRDATTTLPAAAETARTSPLRRAKAFVYETAVRTNKPLDGKPTYARDIVGWFAAVTLFNAIAVWAFWVLGREPDPVPTSTDAVSIEVPAEAATADAAVSDLE
ncbi:MAG: hypothetical protein AAGJ54_08415 [Planctomycetota bacterium]